MSVCPGTLLYWAVLPGLPQTSEEINPSFYIYIVTLLQLSTVVFNYIICYCILFDSNYSMYLQINELRYYNVVLTQDPIQYFVGICVPDSCVEEEVQTLVVYGQ